MRASSAGFRQRKWLALVVAALFGAIVIYAVSSAAPAIPVPDPIVIVHTESGGVVRDTPVPVGGVPIPIDVDNGTLLGLLCPDIDVSVGLISVPDLPNVLVPSITVRRDPLAILRHAPSPPLKINARVIIWDAGKLNRLATVDYGFETPPGARMPPVVKATLTGSITNGFIDPLKARIESPGYSGPLKFNIHAATSTLNADFGLKFDPLPETININEDPRDDGLDFTYDHSGTTPDVKLDATADLLDKTTGRLRHIGAVVERLPNHIQLSNTNTDTASSFEYFSGSDLGKPDIEASYRDVLADGTIVNDVDAKISGLPSHIKGTIGLRPNTTTHTSDIDSVKFDALDGGEIDAVDFVARNWLGAPGDIPLYNLGPEQFVSMVSRRQANGSSRFRAAGRLIGVRGGEFKRSGAAHDKLDVTTNVGGGTLPLRGILDLDTRGAPAADDPKRMFVDSTVTPLPTNIHVFLEPPGTTDPLHVVYDSSSTVDVDTNVVLAKGTANGCGQDQVLCATARIDKLPSHLDAKLPGSKGTDFSISNNATTASHPDVTATVDVGPDTTHDPGSSRTWAKVALKRIPNEVRGRLDSSGGALRAAEFHACAFDFGTNTCPNNHADSIGSVDFTVRDQPSRVGLPPRPDTASQFVTLVSRHKAPGPKHFEVAGHVAEVRNVAFHQLDRHPGDSTTDGVLGALVDLGSGGPFDLAVDTLDDAFADDDHPTTPIGDAIAKVNVHVNQLPERFTACVRSTTEQAFDTTGLPTDALLSACEKNDNVQIDQGEHAVTPLTADYTATNADGSPAPDSAKPVVTADVTSTKPDPNELDALNNPFPTTSQLHLVISKVPSNIHADVIPPITPDATADPVVAGRKLKLVYSASSKIDSIDFALQNRHEGSICEDPRPNRKALCMNGVLENLPAKDPTSGTSVVTTYNPDDKLGDIDVTTSAPPTDKLSINPFHLSKVSPEADSTPLVMDAAIDGLTNHLAGKIQSLVLDGEGLPDDTSKTLPVRIATCSDGVDNDHDHVVDPGNPNLDPNNNIDAKDEDCKKQPARLSFDACPDASDTTCTGIDHITFTATDSLIGDPLPKANPDNTLGSGHGEFSFVQRADDFRAQGDIRQFKRLSYSKLDKDGNASPVTSMSTAFGNGLPLRAFVDRDTGTESQKLDAVITDAPQTIDLCLRDAANIGDLMAADDSTGAGDFCRRSKADGDASTDEGKSAIEIATTPNATKPTINLRSFEMSKGGGTEFLGGNAEIDKLAQRVDVLVGKGDGTELLVEGHNNNDQRTTDPSSVADRVTFALRNFKDNFNLHDFPWDPLDPATEAGPNPDADPGDVDADGKHNYLQLFQNFDGRLVAQGSVPQISRIGVAPRPCDAGNARFPNDPDQPSTQRPDYKCIRAIAAPGHPLGLAVRTLDGDNKVLSLEQGLISSLPDSLTATISSSPDGLADKPICDASHPQPCRPPLLSLVAPPHNGVNGTLRAKFATGPMSILTPLHDATADDTLSQRMNFELSPSDPLFPNPGARVKVGTDSKTGGTALRIGAKLRLAKFIDVDPPTTWDCTHLAENPGHNCSDTNVGSSFNQGFESKDIGVKIVSADNHPLGEPDPSAGKWLGRVAVMVEPTDSETDNTQIVLAGVPSPDNFDPIAHREALGASSKFDDDFPSPSDASNAGFLAPAHLDAQIYLRNNYNSNDGGQNQISFSQIDGRLNAPLSMAVRLNARPPSDAHALKSYVLPTNRSDQLVPPTQLTLRNAPSTNSGDYDQPTFRVRADLLDKFHGPADNGLVHKVFECDGAGAGLNLVLLSVCLLLPVNSETRYLDVQLNADPYATPDGNGNFPNTSDQAARLIEAVAAPFGGSNDVDLRGYKNVNGTGGIFGKGDPAPITPVAALRMTNFNIGLRAGINIGIAGVSVTYEQVGDMLLGLAGRAVDHTRLSHNKASMEIKSEGGTDPNDYSEAMTDLQAQTVFKIHVNALFGLVSHDIVNLSTPPYHQPIGFRPCSATGILGLEFNLNDEFWSGDSNNFLIADAKPGDRKTAFSLADPDPTEWGGDIPTGLRTVSQFLAPLFCFFGTDTGDLINASTPAPPYTVVDHTVPGQPVAPATSSSPSDSPGDSDTTPPNLLVPGGGSAPVVKLCGPYSYNQVIVSGHIVVGAPGDTDDNGRACNGSLQISAKRVVLDGGGKITADNIIPGGPGTPGPGSGSGGGAGHDTAGGRSGRDKAGQIGPGGPNYNTAGDNPDGDFGSEGRLGSGAAGKGGGTIDISVEDEFDNDGVISARGGDGQPAVPIAVGGQCHTGGGGGSGGAIQISSIRITGAGDLNVGGGSGGDGGFGGGGGGAGHITTNVVHNLNSNIHINSTAGGFGAGVEGVGSSNDADYCDGSARNNPRRSGDNGGGGNSSLGFHPDRISTAELSSDNPGPYVNFNPKIDLTAVDSTAGGPVEIILCHKRVDFAGSPFVDTALDPTDHGDTLEHMKDGATCDSPVSLFPTADQANTYKTTVTESLDDNGVYGFFAYTQRPHCVESASTYASNPPRCIRDDPNAPGGPTYQPTYEVQDPLPPLATAKIGIDKHDPVASPAALVGKDGCILSSKCLKVNKGTADPGASDDNGGSGVASVQCRVGTPSTVGSFSDCKSSPAEFNLSEGLNFVDVLVTDRAGNTFPHDGTTFPQENEVVWFVDTHTPNKPTITLTPGDAGHNGWHTHAPSVSVRATDHIPSSGFISDSDSKPVHLFVDAGKVECGSGDPGIIGETDCSTAEIAALNPPINWEGEHTLTATATDRAGWTSDLSGAKTSKVDSTPPTSRLFVGPKLPDGGPLSETDPSKRWYKTQPFIAFGASDSAGGSGVDPTKDVDHVGTGIYFSIDGGTFHLYNADATNVLGDGTHKVCWYAIDLAGNREDADPNTAGNQDNCTTQDIKVDSKAPVVTDPIVPAAPDGANSYYVHKPTVTPAASDPLGADPNAPSGVANTKSGVDKVQYQIDDGVWTTAAPIVVAEGEHVIRTRAFDVAGNAADLHERTVRVDVSKPTGAVASFPPNSNGQGWFRENRIDSVAVRDGRDSSGADGATYKLDGGADVSYLEPFSIGQGAHSVSVTPRDVAGLKGDAIGQVSNVDTTPPVAAPGPNAPGPILISILGIYPTTTFNYNVNDNLSARVKVNVYVYNALGDIIRHIPINGPFAGGYSSIGSASVVWNGLDDAAHGVLPGVYHFRVEALDQAGNSIVSTESPTFLVVQGILPQLGILGL